MHLAAVSDKPGAFVCDPHRSNCHVDGRPYTIEGTEHVSLLRAPGVCATQPRM